MWVYEANDRKCTKLEKVNGLRAVEHWGRRCKSGWITDKSDCLFLHFDDGLYRGGECFSIDWHHKLMCDSNNAEHSPFLKPTVAVRRSLKRTATPDRILLRALARYCSYLSSYHRSNRRQPDSANGGNSVRVSAVCRAVTQWECFRTKVSDHYRMQC